MHNCYLVVKDYLKKDSENQYCNELLDEIDHTIFLSYAVNTAQLSII